MDNKDLNILTDEAIVMMAQEGSNTAYEYLITKYKELARNKAKSYFITGGDNEDVIQEGMIGIFKAIRDFDVEKDTSFKTFATLCVNRQIITAIKTANRQKHQILNESLSLNESNDAGEVNRPLSEVLPSKQDGEPEVMMMMREVVEYLKDNEKDLFSPMENKVWAEMLKGRRCKEIAGVLSLPAKNVDNAMQRIKRKISTYLEQ
ncbi:RNA polymerase sporulation-specific sigma factor [Clostridiales Family XIII bacterium PM5-7]